MIRYWLEGDLYFVSLGEFGALAWGHGFPLQHVPCIPRSAR